MRTRMLSAITYLFLLVSVSAVQDILWSRTYGGSNYDEGYFVRRTSDGGYIVAGYTGCFGAGGSDACLVRVAGEELLAVSIELIPDQSPVIVPRGGSSGFTGTITNTTDEFRWTDVWAGAFVPGMGFYQTYRFDDVRLSPYQSISRHLNQNVPNGAPISDEYSYCGYVGDYSSVVYDSSCFPFEVTAGALTKAGEQGWVMTGSFLEGVSDLPSEFALMSSYPKRFNASTVISCELPADADVRLEVCNISGQKVAPSANSQRQAGYRSVVWDALKVASGVYFRKLAAGDYTQSRRTMLVN